MDRIGAWARRAFQFVTESDTITNRNGGARENVAWPAGAAARERETTHGRATGSLRATKHRRAAGRATAGKCAALGYVQGCALGAAAVALSSAAHAQDCAPHWNAAFANPALDGAVWCFAEHDSGLGPELIAGGSFTITSGAERIARWDGLAWKALGAGLNGSVYALADVALAGTPTGQGARLFAGGAFTASGASSGLQRIACWNESAWLALGGGMNGAVRALVGYDDGAGTRLYAGGDFTQAGGQSAAHIASWNGATWQPLGAGLDSSVAALCVHDDGQGPVLYAAGYFGKSGGAPVSRVARWYNGTWQSTGAPFTQPVLALASWDGPHGRRLAAGGMHSTYASPYVAAYDSFSWSPLGAGFDGPVYALAASGAAGQAILYAGGVFTSSAATACPRVARYDGLAWQAEADAEAHFPLAGGGVFALAAQPPKTNAELAAGGTFTAIDLSRWFALSANGLWGAPGGALDGPALCFAGWNDPFGPALYVGGDFVHAGSAQVTRIARWNGAQWAPLASGVDGPVRALAVYDDASGASLFVAGGFQSALGSHGIPGAGLLRWNGMAWSAPGNLDGEARALAVHDDGSGAALYVAGEFAHVGGMPAARIARYQLGTWSAVGNGFDGSVFALASTPLGLCAGGLFQGSGATPTPWLARWNLSTWQAAGPLLDGPVETLAWLAPFGAPRLYAAGAFTSDGTQALGGLAAFDGTSYTALGTPPSPVRALAAYDDGSGAQLYAGGEFAPSASAPGWLARFDGAHWGGVPKGFGAATQTGGIDGAVRALSVGTSPELAGLHVGGEFQRAGGLLSKGIACWSGCAQGALSISTPEISLVQGGSQQFELSVGAGFAGSLYLVAGSISGTMPGLTLDGVHVPLAADPWTSLLLGAPNQGWYHANLGILSAAGSANARLDVPAGLSSTFAGLKFWHAGIVVDVFLAQVVWASNAVELLLVP
jgi:hypothetical protein